jgi:hypothetical protein
LQSLCPDVDADAEADGWGYIYRKGVYYGALFFDSLNCLANKKESLRNKATVDVHWVCITTARIVPIFQVWMRVVCIHVWASALLDLERRAMRDA